MDKYPYKMIKLELTNEELKELRFCLRMIKDKFDGPFNTIPETFRTLYEKAIKHDFSDNANIEAEPELSADDGQPLELCTSPTRSRG